MPLWLDDLLHLSNFGEAVIPGSLADSNGTWCCLKVQHIVCSEILFCSPRLFRVFVWVAIVFLSALTWQSSWLLLTGCMFLCHSVKSRDCCAWNYQIRSFWNIQGSLSGTNNHAMIKVKVVCSETFFLLSTAVKSSYLRYHSLPGNWNHLANLLWPLASLINHKFPSSWFYALIGCSQNCINRQVHRCSY